MNYIKDYTQIQLSDVPSVGGKNASLGQMIKNLTKKGVRVPGGFAVLASAYKLHLEENNLVAPLKKILKEVTKTSSLATLARVAKKARQLIDQAPLPQVVVEDIIAGYRALCKKTKQAECSVAVRSSATAEDLPDASFAGQQETYLNIRGEQAVVTASRKCMASLFTDRAIVYRLERGYDHFAVALSVGIQQMIRSDKACAGVMFTIDTETGFKDATVITASYGLGETVVQGEVIPDEFHIFKPKLQVAPDPIIKKSCGSKLIYRIFGTAKDPVVVKKVPAKLADTFCLTDAEIIELATYGKIIEDHYTELKGAWSPMDIEWAKDGLDGKLYIVQSRPETVHALEGKLIHTLEVFTLKGKKNAKVLAQGQSIGQQAAQGKACVIRGPSDSDKIKKGDILVTRMTDPDWVPIMKKAAGIITESGGRTCHAAIVSRELGIPAIVGAAGVLKTIKNGQMITMDCSAGSQGYVYEGNLTIDIKKVELGSLKKPPTSVMINIAAPDRAYTLAALPVDGVGLARLEFIITNEVQIHPMALVNSRQEQAKIDAKTKKQIAKMTHLYKNSEDFFVKKVAQGAGTIGAAFFPRPVIVRFSDFKSNEYRNLIGGSFFEPLEENPMIGLRGASRYHHPLYAPAFKLECAALRYVRESMGLTNVHVMIPFVRTLGEAQAIITLLNEQGLKSGKDGLKIYMMCEIPSNVILIKDFAKYFDGFSIGSNDLTQTTLSIDRDSGLLASLFDERDPAVMYMLEQAIKGAHAAKKHIGICGQAPSDYPEIAEFLMKQGIDSLSLNPDSVLPFLQKYGK